MIKYFTQRNISLKTFNSEFLFTEVCFTDQHSESLELENKIL